MTKPKELTYNHYRPAKGVIYCSSVRTALKRARESGKGISLWNTVHTTSDIKKVTCPDCKELIRAVVTNYKV